jgi:hypothetical protein
MPEYELVKKLGSYDNFNGLKSRAKVPWHKLSAPTVCETRILLLALSRYIGDPDVIYHCLV